MTGLTDLNNVAVSDSHVLSTLAQSERRTVNQTQTIYILKTIGEVRAIQPIWEAMQAQSATTMNVEVNFERYVSIIESNTRHLPYIQLLFGNQKPQAMLIGTYGPIRIPCKLGYMQLLNPTLNGVKVMYGGYLGDWSEDTRHQMLEHLYTSLCNGNGDVARFEQVPQHSELYAWLRTHPPIWCRSHFPKSDKHWQMDIPNQMEAFFEHHSSKTRQTLKRYMRKLEKHHRVRILECLDVKTMSDVLPKAEAISQKTYQHALGWGFVNDVQTRHQLEVAAQSGWLRFHVLLLDEIPCAFQYGFCCQGTYYLKTMGFDPEYGKLHAGTVLFLKIIEKLCRDPETDCFDFGYGDAEYKRRFGNVQWDEATVYIYARRFYPMLVNLIHGTIRAVSVGMRWIVHKTGSEGRIKQLWRRLLRKNN